MTAAIIPDLIERLAVFLFVAALNAAHRCLLGALSIAEGVCR
jgi:hypothetical protein